jgi:hypothetical protein
MIARSSKFLQGRSTVLRSIRTGVSSIFPFSPASNLDSTRTAFTCVADTSSSGVVQATAVSASEINKTRSSQSSSPPSRASAKYRAARPSTLDLRAAPLLTGAGCTGLRANGRFRAMGVRGSRGAVSDSCRILCEWLYEV